MRWNRQRVSQGSTASRQPASALANVSNQGRGGMGFKIFTGRGAAARHLFIASQAHWTQLSVARVPAREENSSILPTGNSAKWAGNTPKRGRIGPNRR